MTDLNLLMSRIEEINRITDPHALTADDISTLITYHRRNRARKAAGLKDDRPKSTTPPVDLSRLLNIPVARPANLPTITRR